MKKANPMYLGLYSQLGQYWGEQPGTSGPVYVGAFVMFLFILGCFIVKGPMKWALIVGTVFSIVLSWGKNFMGVTDFFISGNCGIHYSSACHNGAEGDYGASCCY